MKIALRVALLIAVGLPGLASAQADKDKPARASKKADIYDEQADVKALVDAAVAKAHRENSRVLVMFGGNWCGWCHKLHELFKSDGEIAKTLLYEYQLVMADTKAKNAEALMEAWKVDHSKGVPYLVVLDGEGKIVSRQETGVLEEGDHHDPKKVLAFLKEQSAMPVGAQGVLDAALARASSEDKRVFLHFGAPWCGWCHRLEDFLAQPEIASLMARDYIDVKIDTDRMTGGEKLLAEYCKKPGGIPWYVILDADGKPLATSDAEKGNIGYPAEPHEIDAFMALLKQTARHLEPEQQAMIERTLKERAAKLKH